MILFFDTETTGLPRNWNAPVSDLDNWPRLVQIAWLVYDYEGNRLSEKDYIVKPVGFSIPIDAAAIHKITTEKALSFGNEIRHVLEELSAVLAKADYVVAHNIDYDEKILGAEFLRHGIKNVLVTKKKICTMLSSTNYCAIPGKRGYRWPKLSELYNKIFSTSFKEAHNAIVDIRVTARCFWELHKMGIISLHKPPHNQQVENIRFRANSQDRPMITEEYSPGLSVTSDLPELIPYRKGDKWGFCDRNKNILIDCKYLDVEPFVEHLSRVRIEKDGREFFRFIDKTGNELTNCKQYDGMDNFSEGLAAVNLNDKYGFIDKNGQEIIPCTYENAYYLGLKSLSFSEGMAAVSKNGKWGFINQTGDKVIPFIYDWAENFSEGLAAVELKGKYGFINKNGEQVIPCIYDSANKFSEGLAGVMLQSNNFGPQKWGFLDKSNNLIIPCVYGCNYLHLPEGYYSGVFFDGILSQGVIFSQGLAVVSGTNEFGHHKYGYIDKTGQLQIPLVFNEATSFSNGLAAVRIGYEKWVFIDKSGKKTIPKTYPGIDHLFRDHVFVNGIARTCWGYIDKNGTEYWNKD